MPRAAAHVQPLYEARPQRQPHVVINGAAHTSRPRKPWPRGDPSHGRRAGHVLRGLDQRVAPAAGDDGGRSTTFGIVSRQ